jgi:hypothetical protein
MRALDAVNWLPAAAKADRRGGRRQLRGRRRRNVAAPARGDVGARVVEYVTANPGSTARGVADALRLKRRPVAARSTELAKRGDLVEDSARLLRSIAGYTSRVSGSAPRRFHRHQLATA